MFHGIGQPLTLAVIGGFAFGRVTAALLELALIDAAEKVDAFGGGTI
jgi:hypothetical protein